MKNLLRLVVVILMMGSAYAQSNLPACPSSGYFDNCFGNHTNADGEKYVGEYQNGVRFGHGIQYNKNGSILRSGTWLNDQLMSSHPVDKDSFPFNPLAITLATNNQSSPVQPNFVLSNLAACPSSGFFHNCFGTFTSADGEIYVGEFKDDKRNGWGTQTYASGNGGYVGEWKDGKRNGQGTFTFPDGTIYVGEYKDGLYNGKRTLTGATGNKYVGEFKGAKFNGRGTLYASNGSIIDQGIYADNKFVRSAPVQQATAPNQEIDRLRAEAEEAKRKQAELANAQRNGNIRQRNLSINWQLEAQGNQLGNMSCQVTNISSQGRTSNGEAKFWLNVSCRTRQGSGISGGFEVFCGVQNQQVVRSSTFTAVCNGS